MEILRDDKLYYKSGVSSSFNKFTDEGKEALLEYMLMMAPHMIELEQQELTDRSKKLMMDKLKE